MNKLSSGNPYEPWPRTDGERTYRITLGIDETRQRWEFSIPTVVSPDPELAATALRNNIMEAVFKLLQKAGL